MIIHQYLIGISFIFIFFFTNSPIKAENFTKSCEGYCENEKYIIEKAMLGVPSQIKKANKKYKILEYPKFLRVEKSPCMPFLHYHTNIDHKPIESSYSLNSCMPCPPSIEKSNKNKVGFCSIPSIGLRIIYEESINKKLWSKEWTKFFDEWVVGRNMKGEHYELSNAEVIVKKKDLSPSAIDFNKTLENNRKNIIAEILEISLSFKESFFVMRVISPIDNSNTPMLYYGKMKFKTPQKEFHQITKMSETVYFNMESFMDLKFYQFINDYIYKIQKNFHQAFHNKTYEKTSSDPSILYELILDDEELDLLATYLDGIKEFNIQTRN